MTQDNNTTPGGDKSPPEGILEKIQKLIAKASDPSVTEAESEAFFAKAYALMAKWQVDEAVLRMAAGANRDPDDVIIRERIEGMPWTTYKHRSLIWHIVCKHNSCMAVVDVQSRAPKVYERDENGNVIRDASGRPKATRKRGGVLIVGYKSDIQRVKLLASALDLHMSAAGTKSIRNLAGSDKYYGRESFNHGFIRVLSERMEEAYAKTNADAEASAPGVGLALIDRAEQVEAELAGQTRPSRAVSLTSKSNGAQYRAGQEAAATADIGLRGVGGEGEHRRGSLTTGGRA